MTAAISSRTLRSATRNLNQIPIPHGSIPEPRGQDLDFINVAHSHLIHSDWGKLAPLSPHLTPFRVKHVQLKIQRDFVLSLEFFNWVKTHNAAAHTLETHSIILHVLTKNRKFKSAESIARDVLKFGGSSVDLADQLFDVLLHSYRVCDSSARVFDLVFSTCARSKKFRFATDVFRRMKEYGFLPTVESCNAYLRSLLDMGRVDIVFVFRGEMQRCGISPNVYTLNMVMSALCKAGRLEKAVKLFGEMENGGVRPDVASYNVVIAGYCRKGLLSAAMKVKSSMEKANVGPDVVTFNTLIHGFCKEGKLQEARKLLSEMKHRGNVAPNAVTFNTLMNGYNQVGGNCGDVNDMLYQEMLSGGIKPDILTYNALIAGLCREGKTKKAAYLVKELVDKEKMAPTASTFAALIAGQCARSNPDRGFQLYKAMARSGFQLNRQTFDLLVDAFCKKKDFEGAARVLLEMFEQCVTPASEFIVDTYNGLRQCGMDRLAAKLRSAVEARNLAIVDLGTS